MKMIKNKLIATTLLVGTILSMGSVVSASYTDIEFYDYCGYADGDGFATDDRQKDNRTSVYINNKSDYTLDVAVRATDDYSNHALRASENGFVHVDHGKWRIMNDVKESGYNWCYLKITDSRDRGERIFAFGEWSPDCAGDYGVVNPKEKD